MVEETALATRRALGTTPASSSEQDVMAFLEAQGLNEERLGAVDWRQAIRDVRLQTELAGSSGSVTSGPQSVSQTLPQSTEELRAQAKKRRDNLSPTEQEEARIAAMDAARAKVHELSDVSCPACNDERRVRLTTDRADPRFGIAMACTQCVTPAERAMMAGVPWRHRESTVESFEPLPGKEAARAFAEGWDCWHSVVFASRAEPLDRVWGTGKTHLACALLRRALEHDIPGRFLAVPDFLEQIKARYDDRSEEQAESYVEQVAREPLLVLDDLGAERGTEWTQGQLYRLLDARYRAQLTTIVTTNYANPEAMAEGLGGAVGSRLAEWDWVLVGGIDMRQRQGAN